MIYAIAVLEQWIWWHALYGVGINAADDEMRAKWISVLYSIGGEVFSINHGIKMSHKPIKTILKRNKVKC